MSSAVLAVRGAMQHRRQRAEQAWRDAEQCALAGSVGPSATRAEGLAHCRETARLAAELCLELPEHGRQQLELQAALAELVSALESADEQRLASAIDRSSRAGSALGWRVGHTGLH
ncbi:MAG TPA: hypothetical protein VGJ91_16255 [Polyangiaceae bacterium]